MKCLTCNTDDGQCSTRTWSCQACGLSGPDCAGVPLPECAKSPGGVHDLVWSAPSAAMRRYHRLLTVARRYLLTGAARELCANVACGDEAPVAEIRASIERRRERPEWWPAGTVKLELGQQEQHQCDRLARALALAWAEPDVDDPEALRGDHLRQQRKDDR